MTSDNNVWINNPFNKELLAGLKQSLLIPDKVNVFDHILSLYVIGAEEYVDSIMSENKFLQDSSVDDNSHALSLYKLTIIYLAQFEWLNRDSGSNKNQNFPITIQALLNKLESLDYKLDYNPKNSKQNNS